MVTGRPVKLEFTREEEFIACTTRHPARLHVKAGATRDGRLTALQIEYVYNTGAYGGHGGDRAVPFDGRIDLNLSLCEQEDRCVLRVYQHGAFGSFSRIRPFPDYLRDRIHDR